jgi:hypothetical protein
MVEHVAGKPRVGSFVDYYNPRLMQRIGFTEGYGKRYDGPYAAIVTNNIGDGVTLTVHLPGVNPMELVAVPHKDKAPAFVSQDGTNHPAQNGNGYWEWQSPIHAARAAKELKSAGTEDHGSSGS